MEQKICIGKIVKSVGLKGEVKILPLTDSTNRFKKLKYVFVDGEKFAVEHASVRQDCAVLKLENISSVDTATKLKDKLIFVDRLDAIALKQNQFFIVDLIDATLVLDGKAIGKIVDTENFGASDIIVFNAGGREYRAPFVSDFFADVNVETRQVVVTPKIFEVME